VLAFVLTCLSPPALAADPPADAILAELPFLASEAVNQVVIDLAPEGNARRLRMLMATGRGGGAEAELCDARAMGIRRTHRRRTLLGTDLDFTIYDSRRSFFGIGFGAPCILRGTRIRLFSDF
jgi:hypothetical protein